MSEEPFVSHGLLKTSLESVRDGEADSGSNLNEDEGMAGELRRSEDRRVTLEVSEAREPTGFVVNLGS